MKHVVHIDESEYEDILLTLSGALEKLEEMRKSTRRDNVIWRIERVLNILTDDDEIEKRVDALEGRVLMED
jgi:hypothetical protein